jgi:hypothetical protein
MDGMNLTITLESPLNTAAIKENVTDVAMRERNDA